MKDRKNRGRKIIQEYCKKKASKNKQETRDEEVKGRKIRQKNDQKNIVIDKIKENKKRQRKKYDERRRKKQWKGKI